MGKAIIKFDAATTNELLDYVKEIKDGGGINLDAPKDGNLYGQQDGEWKQAQEKLVDGESIKTLNGVSVLGSGNIDVAPTIGDNGNWYINGEDTGKPSKGTDGKNGADGVSLGEIALVQETGTENGSENKVMSQKAISTELIKRTTELNISALYPTSGIDGSNRYDLAGAIAQVPAEYRTIVGLKITFINNATSKTETWKYDGGTFTSTTSWKQGDGSGGNKILEWNTDVATTRKQVFLSDRKEGMQISYLHPDYGWINEQYTNSDVSDEYWGDNRYWNLLNTLNVIDKNRFIYAVTDAEEKVLFGVKSNGEFYFAKGIPEPIQRYLSESIASKIEKIYDTRLMGYTELLLDQENKIVAYRDLNGKRYESRLDFGELYKQGERINIVNNIKQLEGVIDYSLPNLFDATKIRTYDSDFADKVLMAIGRKTGDTGCYSNNIPCKIGDVFTRNDFGTGIVVVLDNQDNILGDIKDAAYQPTICIKPAIGQNFDKAAYVVFVVMLANLEGQRIVKAGYMPSSYEDKITVPRLRILQENIDSSVNTYIKSTTGKMYKLIVDDSEGTPNIVAGEIDGDVISMSDLPSDFPKYSYTGDCSTLYKSLLFCPIEGGVTPYLIEIDTLTGLVKRYIQAKVNCPRVIEEDGVTYVYGVDGNLNSSSGRLSIYRGNGKTFDIVKSGITDSEGNLLEPHDCLVLSINPLHIITQRYVPNAVTIVNGESKTITALHIEEQYNGKRVWIWKSEDYPELWNDSHVRNGDYLHNNTIDIDDEGNLCLNNKHANQVLIIERTWNQETNTGTIGNILWKIGGNRGEINGVNYDTSYNVNNRIKTTDEQQWYESHDAIITNGIVTMFDNSNNSESRILEFQIDKSLKVLTGFKEYTYNKYSGRYMGSSDRFSQGIYLVSWGSSRNNVASNAGVYDFIYNRAFCEIRLENQGASMYRIYGIKKQI